MPVTTIYKSLGWEPWAHTKSTGPVLQACVMRMSGVQLDRILSNTDLLTCGRANRMTRWMNNWEFI